jgi:transcription termination/antitermination protein NusG
MAKKWYVIHTQTGSEEKVKSSIEKRAESNNMKGSISQILIPTEQVSEVKEGKKKISQRKFFPGYVLVEMELTDQSWYLIKNTAGVTGFIGARAKPAALREEEVQAILRQSEERKVKPSPKVILDKGESVRVTDGPFTNFNGSIEEVNPDKGKLKVSVTIFGRSTPVELEYWQVEKL